MGNRPARSPPEQVAAYLRDFLADAGGDWDWDDFTSDRLADPRLESICERAAAVDLPLDASGEQALRELLAEAEALSAEGPA